jgi:polysaccharide export outer membrane protein
MIRRYFLKQSTGVFVAMSPLGGAGCALLPRSGPMTAEMNTLETPDDLEGLVAQLTADVAAAAPSPESPRFPASHLSMQPIDPSRLGVDDLLEVTIWESQGAGLFNVAGGPAQLPAARVDPSGRVFVPFAGFQRAAGATISELRERIRMALEPLTLSPQVDVRLREPRSRLVAVQGAVAAPGIYPIERPTTRLGAMIAQAGGAADSPGRTEVALQRSGEVSRQLLADILRDPRLDIALRPGDQIVLSPIRERFIVLGASSTQAEIAFPTRPLTLLSALATARGLRDFDADPSGVFIFRYEDAAFATSLLAGPAPEGLPAGPGRPIVYRLDLSQPENFFVARSFQMRDGDAIFVTNAPLTEVRKFLQLFNSVVTPVNTVNNFAL